MISTNTPTDALARARDLAGRAELWADARAAVTEAAAAEAMREASAEWEAVAGLIHDAMRAHPSRWRVGQEAVAEAMRSALAAERRANGLATPWLAGGRRERSEREAAREARRSAAKVIEL